MTVAHVTDAVDTVEVGDALVVEDELPAGPGDVEGGPVEDMALVGIPALESHRLLLVELRRSESPLRPGHQQLELPVKLLLRVTKITGQ